MITKIALTVFLGSYCLQHFVPAFAIVTVVAAGVAAVANVVEG